MNVGSRVRYIGDHKSFAKWQDRKGFVLPSDPLDESWSVLIYGDDSIQLPELTANFTSSDLEELPSEMEELHSVLTNIMQSTKDSADYYARGTDQAIHNAKIEIYENIISAINTVIKG